MEPNGDGHDYVMYIQPRSTRDTSDFYNNRKYGELWVWRRYTTDETLLRFGIEVRKVEELKTPLKDESLQ
jgi:Xaa-Pro aminopeptidase